MQFFLLLLFFTLHRRSITLILSVLALSSPLHRWPASKRLLQTLHLDPAPPPCSTTRRRRRRHRKSATIRPRERWAFRSGRHHMIPLRVEGVCPITTRPPNRVLLRRLPRHRMETNPMTTMQSKAQRKLGFTWAWTQLDRISVTHTLNFGDTVTAF